MALCSSYAAVSNFVIIAAAFARAMEFAAEASSSTSVVTASKPVTVSTSIAVIIVRIASFRIKPIKRLVLMLEHLPELIILLFVDLGQPHYRLQVAIIST